MSKANDTSLRGDKALALSVVKGGINIISSVITGRSWFRSFTISKEPSLTNKMQFTNSSETKNTSLYSTVCSLNRQLQFSEFLPWESMTPFSNKLAIGGL